MIRRHTCPAQAGVHRLVQICGEEEKTCLNRRGHGEQSRGLRPQPKPARAKACPERSRRDEENAKKTGPRGSYPLRFWRPAPARDTIPWGSISYVRCFPKSSRKQDLDRQSYGDRRENAKWKKLGASTGLLSCGAIEGESVPSPCPPWIPVVNKNNQNVPFSSPRLEIRFHDGDPQNGRW